MKLEDFPFFFFLYTAYVLWPKLWGNKSQEISFWWSTKGQISVSHINSTMNTVVFVIWIHRIFSWELARYIATFFTWRLTKLGWGRNARLGITDSATACSKWFLFLDHTGSEGQKQQWWQKKKQFLGTSTISKWMVYTLGTTRKQVLGRPRDKWRSTKIHYLQVSKYGCCTEDC